MSACMHPHATSHIRAHPISEPICTGCHGCQMGSDGIPCAPIASHSIPLCTQQFPCLQVPWAVGGHGMVWSLHGRVWEPMGVYGSSWEQSWEHCVLRVYLDQPWPMTCGPPTQPMQAKLRYHNTRLGLPESGSSSITWHSTLADVWYAVTQRPPWSWHGQHCLWLQSCR